MQPKKHATTGEDDLFRARLDQIINMKHELVQLAGKLDWVWLDDIDWDQPRSLYLSAPCGVEANADFASIRLRVQKMADIGSAFETTARRREAKARAAEAEGSLVTARDNYFMAAIHWGAAQWTYDETNDANIALNKSKRECYAAYARLAEHKVEAAWVPFKNTALPAWLHLAARLSRWAHAHRGRDPGHGQLQGDPGRTLRRPLA